VTTNTCALPRVEAVELAEGALALSTVTNSSDRSRVSGMLQMREAVLLIFCDGGMPENSCLHNLSGWQWKKLLHWLDTSGLALYFYDRLRALGKIGPIPTAVQERLEQNLGDNIARTRGMLAELDAIQRELQRVGADYAVLKGFSLWPHSVAQPRLRSQLDIDFLIAEDGIGEAVEVLTKRGYHLFAKSGNSWEFKIGQMREASLKTLYKPVRYGCVELHVAADRRRTAMLSRTQTIEYDLVPMPVLASADLFLGQGLHAFKHICSESSRASHLLEFWRHVITRRSDTTFWRDLRMAAEPYPRAPIELGVVLLIATQLMGEFAPEALTCWTVDRLPSYARLWVELYGRRAVLGGSRGSKLYLLLQRELAADGAPASRTVAQVLVPRSLPKLMTYDPGPESLADRLGRYHIKFQVLRHRLRFHVVEGVRYLLHAARWRRHMARLGRPQEQRLLARNKGMTIR
jgi:hypothetical protein